MHPGQAVGKGPAGANSSTPFVPRETRYNCQLSRPRYDLCHTFWGPCVTVGRGPCATQPVSDVHRVTRAAAGMSAPPPPGTICSCIADLQSQVLGSLGGMGRAVAGPGPGLARRRPAFTAAPQRINSVSVGRSRSNPTAPQGAAPSHTPAKPLSTPAAGSGRARKAEVKKPIERSRSSKLQPSGKGAPANHAQDDEVLQDYKDLMKKIFKEEHETKGQAYWRERGEEWVNSTIKGPVTR